MFHTQDGCSVTREEAAEIQLMILPGCEKLLNTVLKREWKSPWRTVTDFLSRKYSGAFLFKCSFDTGNFVPCDGDVLPEFEFYRDWIVEFFGSTDMNLYRRGGSRNHQRDLSEKHDRPLSGAVCKGIRSTRRREQNSTASADVPWRRENMYLAYHVLEVRPADQMAYEDN